jgi:hypothetical protein
MGFGRSFWRGIAGWMRRRDPKFLGLRVEVESYNIGRR